MAYFLCAVAVVSWQRYRVNIISAQCHVDTSIIESEKHSVPGTRNNV